MAADELKGLRELPGAVMGSGADAAVVAHFGDPIGEQRAWAAGRGVVDLANLTAVRVSGPDRLTWLHAITSQDLAELPPGRSAEALILDAAGHIEQAFGVIDDGESTYLLVGTRAADALTEYLTSMKFRSNVNIGQATDLAPIGRRLADADAPWPVWTDPWPGVAVGGTRYGLPSDAHPAATWSLAIGLVPRARLARHLADLADAGIAPVGMAAIEAARIAAWRPRAGHELDERTLPAELDWLRTAVHLNKGCYRGQESVAKIHNVGRPPRRLVFLHLDGSGHLLPDPGAALRSSGEVVGRITSVARHYELGPIALGMVRRTLPMTDELTADGPEGPIAAAQEAIVPCDGHDADRPEITRPARRSLL